MKKIKVDETIKNRVDDFYKKTPFVDSVQTRSIIVGDVPKLNVYTKIGYNLYVDRLEWGEVIKSPEGMLNLYDLKEVIPRKKKLWTGCDSLVKRITKDFAEDKESSVMIAKAFTVPRVCLTHFKNLSPADKKNPRTLFASLTAYARMFYDHSAQIKLSNALDENIQKTFQHDFSVNSAADSFLKKVVKDIIGDLNWRKEK